jgi:hypothetical protein
MIFSVHTFRKKKKEKRKKTFDMNREWFEAEKFG